MDNKNPYFKQVELLVRILPLVGGHPCFALKGGTAINLFHRNMPRLSVDIDLVYVPIGERIESLEEMPRNLKSIGSATYRNQEENPRHPHTWSKFGSLVGFFCNWCSCGSCSRVHRPRCWAL